MAEQEEEMTTKKGNFREKSDSVLSLLSRDTINAKKRQNKGILNDTQKIVIQEPEARTRRVQSLIQPSVYNRLAELAAATDESVNEHINRAIIKYIEGEKEQ